jgi:hypothetical protein
MLFSRPFGVLLGRRDWLRLAGYLQPLLFEFKRNPIAFYQALFAGPSAENWPHVAAGPVICSDLLVTFRENRLLCKGKGQKYVRK